MEKKKTQNKAKSKTDKVSLDHNKYYDLLGVKGPNLKKGETYLSVKGDSAEAIVKSGQGKLK